MSITKRMRELIYVTISLVLSIPIHELGHYIVAKIDGAQMYDFQGFISFNGTHILGPGITINEFTFSSIWTLLLCYFGGFLITSVPGFIASIILYTRKSNSWYYTSMWVVSAPLTSLGDFDRVLELLWLSDIIKWMYFGLGAYMILALLIVHKKKEALINATKD